jgi:class 3 adenylate cyclase
LLNGVPLGTRWYGRHRYDLRGAARPGRNALRIVFTSTLFNYCRTQGGANPDIKFWLRSGTDPVPSGILGPVRLFRLTRAPD